jgi:hypothetical protein
MFEYILQKEKAEEINFGLGDDEYKKAWLGARRELWGIKIYNIYTVGGFFGAVRQILPEKLSAFLKGIWAFMVVQRNKTLKEVHLKGRPRCGQIRDVALDEI